MKTVTRLLAIALVAFATLTACGRSDDGGIITPPPFGVTQPSSGVWRGQAVTPNGPDVSTSFEDNEVTNGGVGPFSVGASPFTATFSDGNAEERGEPSFYITGDNAWHVLVGTSATVTFESPPSSLSFWVRTENAADVSTIEIFDENSALILPVITPTSTYTQIFVTRTAAETPIGSMVVTSTGGGDVVIDALTFGYLSTTDNINCLVAETLELVCAVTDVTGVFVAGVRGTVQVTGSQVTGTGTLYAGPGTSLADGSTFANLIISAGTVSERNSLDLTISGVAVSISLATTFDASYNRGSALATVDGNFPTFDIFGDPGTFTVNADVITLATNSLCVGNGQISIIDANFNAYAVTLDVTSCGALDGMYTGLGLTGDAMMGTDNVFSFRVFTSDSVIVGDPTK